MILLRA